jgi:uncharacterized protein (TIGR03437 family)
VFLGLALHVQAQSGPPPVVFSVNNSADYSTTVAQGSLIVVFGENLGPANLVQVSQFPLTTNLAGTSVTVTAGSVILNCPMLYTSAGQVAAILPSNTPLGTVSVSVAYKGLTQTGVSTTTATVVPNSPGIYTITSSGLGTGIFTALDGTVKTLNVSAKPGELVYVWGTGLGPIGTPDNVLPPTFPNFPSVRVLVGGQPAQITYAGRSGCCAAVDQIAFTVPAVPNGCDIPVVIMSGGSPSNTVTIPVNASGGPCTDNGPTLPSSILTKAASGQPVKVAAIAVGSPRILGATPEPRLVAARLSAALHVHVAEADAAKLLRAYRARSSAGVRSAMARYFVQWKALSPKARARIIAQVSQSQDSVLAEFGSFSGESVAANVVGALFPPVGECETLPGAFPYGLGSVSAGLDAGPSLALTGAAGSLTLNKTGSGQYQASFGTTGAGQMIPLGSYTISGSGGHDAGAFSATVNVAGHLSISNKESLAAVDRTQPLTVTWTGGTSGNYVLIGGGSTHVPHGYFACVEDAGKGTFTIPGYIVSSIPATIAGDGVVFIAPHPLSNQIAIPGIDLAYFIDGSNDSVNTDFVNPNTPGTPNAKNIVGSIDGLYPASGAVAAQNNGMSTLGPVAYSALLTAGTFNVSFDIAPNANPFQVVAVSPAGSATIGINPSQGTWQAVYTVPGAAARVGDFSHAGFTVTNFLNGLPFPNNVVPQSLMDPLAENAALNLMLPNGATTGANGVWSSSGTLPAGRVLIGFGGALPSGFGGYINLTKRGQQSVGFSLSVDGSVVASKQISFTTD